MKEPSKAFEHAFGLGVGSPELECICGRRHCAPDSDCIEEAEAEDMRNRHAANSRLTAIHSGVDGISAKVIDGQTVVVECGCQFLVRLESILWNERDRILTYYKIRREAVAKQLAELDAGLQP